VLGLVACAPPAPLRARLTRPGAQICEYYLAEVEKNGGGRQEARSRSRSSLSLRSALGPRSRLHARPRAQIPSVLTTPLNYIFHIEARSPCAVRCALPIR